MHFARKLTRRRRNAMSAFLLGVKADVTRTVLECLARSNAAQWGTHSRRRNRKCSDAVVAVVRSTPLVRIEVWPGLNRTLALAHELRTHHGNALNSRAAC